MNNLAGAPLTYDNRSPLGAENYTEATYVVNSENLIQRPDVLETIFPHLKEETDFLDFFVRSGRTQKTVQNQFHHFEEAPLIPLPQIKSHTGSSGNGNVVNITIEAINADKLVPFNQGDIWNVGGVEGWVEAQDDITVDGTNGEHVVTLKPTSDENIVAATADTEFMIWIGSAFADGTEQPEGMYSKPVQFSGNTQIIKTSFLSDGSAAANMTMLPVTKSGKQYAYIRGVDQALIKHKMAIGHRLGIGKGSFGTLLDADNASKAVNKTEGMDWKIKNGGFNEPYIVFDYANWIKIEKALNTQNAPKEYIVCAGNDAYIEAMQIFFDKGITAETRFEAFSGNDYTSYGHADPKKRALDLGYNSLHFMGRTYHMKDEKWLNYKQTTGAPGQPYKKNLYFLPMGKYTSKNGDTGEIETNEICRVRFKASDLENRFMQSWTQDKKVNTNGKDVFKFYHSSDLGWQQAQLHLAIRAYYDASASS